MTILYVLGLSILLQFLAAVLAFRLIWVTGKQLAWLLISSAIFLMAVRRSISFYSLASQGFQSGRELSSELVALSISVLMVVGIGLIGGVFKDKKAAEQASRAAEERYRQFVETANEGIWSINEQFKTTFVNKKMADMLGYSPEEMLGRPLASFLFKEDLPDFEDRMRKRAEGAKEIYESRFRQKGGNEIWTFISATPIFDEAGVFQGAFAMHSDVTKLKRIQEKLRESEEKFSKVFRYAPVVMTLTTMDDGMCLDVNDKYCDISGFTREEAIGRTAVELGWFSREDRELLIEKLRMHGYVSGVEIEQFSKDKRQFIFLYYGQLINVSGRSVLLSIAHDVTELRKAHELLQRSGEKYRKLFEDAPLIHVITRNEQGVPFISDCNKLFLSSIGFNREEVIGKPLADFYSPESRTRLLEGGGYARALAGEFVMGERELITHDGSLIQTFLYTKPETDQLGNVTGTQAMFVDITAARKAEEAQRRLATAIDQATEGVIVTDTEGNIQYVNPAICSMTGHSPEELIGSNPRILKSGEHDSIFYKELWDTIKSGATWSGRFINRKKTGQTYYEDATISPVKDTSGKIVNFVAVKRDITEHLELSKQLQQAQKMEAIGALAGGVAHDFNNLLQIVLGYSEFMLQRKKEGENDYADLQKITQAGNRGTDLVKRLLMFSRKAESQPKPINLNEQVEQLTKMLARTIPQMIEIERLLAPDLTKINADPTQMDQILMNLAVNARDAMHDGGKLTIKTANIILNEEYCKAHVGIEPGAYVELSVSDTGQGMDAETLEHIFEPFFTTKEKEKGTGLGLSTVYGIVKQHNGSIDCESEIGQGTTFKIYLPAIPTQKEIDEDTTEEHDPKGGTETILVVDDEGAVREMIERILSQTGYTVMTACDGEEALDLYKREHGKISSVILDLMMPKMGGQKCLREILQIDPGAKILILTGYDQDSEITKLAIDSGARGSIHKPLRVNTILRTIREILDMN